MHPLWPALDELRNHYFGLLARIRGSVADPKSGDAVRSMIGKARSSISEIHDLALQILPELSEEEHLSIRNHKTGETIVAEAVAQDMHELLAQRLAQLDRLAKIESEIRKEGRLLSVPWGGIRSHERDGRHLIAEHVGKSRSELREQLDEKPKSKAASTFPNVITADRAAAEVLAHNHQQISDWLERGLLRRLSLVHECKFEVGEVLERNGRHSSTSKVKLILIRDNNTLLGYQIMTGFPTL